MTRLTVFYDARCGLCCAVRDWIGRQRQLVRVECYPKHDGMDDLVVVADSGEMWSGDSAWVMVLWALEDYRDWARRLASPVLLPAARSVFARLSKYRGALSCQLGLPADPHPDLHPAAHKTRGGEPDLHPTAHKTRGGGPDLHPDADGRPEG